MCKSPLECNYSCSKCIEWLKDMDEYFSNLDYDIYKCTYCETREDLNPLYWICRTCLNKRKKLADWIESQPCQICNRLCPYGTTAHVHNPDGERVFFWEIIPESTVEPYNEVGWKVSCRMCRKPPPKGSRAGTLCVIADMSKLAYRRCVMCNLCVTQENQHLFEWDHIYPRFGESPCISALQMKSSCAFNLKILLAELQKCRVMCLNCHDAHTKWQSTEIFAPIRYWDWEHCRRAHRKKGTAPLPPIIDLDDDDLLDM